MCTTCHLYWQIGQDSDLPEITNQVEDGWILLLLKFHWIPFGGYWGEVKMYQPIRGQGGHLVLRSAPKHEHGRGRWDLSSCQISMNSVQRFQKRSRICLSQSETRSAIVYFGSARKTQTWQRTLISCLLSIFVEFRWCLQRRSRKCLRKSEAIWFFGSDRKYKLGRARWDLASCQVSLNSVQRTSRKCISQLEATAAILFFRSARKTQTW